MNEHNSILGTKSPQSLNEEFKRRAKKTSGAAAMAMLARGKPITYRNDDTAPGHVIRKHPDGRTEIIKVDLEVPEKSRAE